MKPGGIAGSRLLLVGGGHAHIHLLKRAAEAPLAVPGGVELVLVSPAAFHHYSGMVPAYLAGRQAEDALAFDLRRLSAAAGARFVEAAAESIDAAARTVEAGGETISWDLLSLDIGSQAAGLATPGASTHALAVRPIGQAVELRRRATELAARAAGGAVALTVVGGGAAGVEVALALDRLVREMAARPAVTIVERAPWILPEFPRGLRRSASNLLDRRGIAVRCGQAVAALEADSVLLADGSRLPSALTVWIAGAAPPALLSRSDLPRDRRGFLLVDETLRAVDRSPVFGAGDCIALAGHPEVAKAGVYAVREAPILDHNLRAVLRGERLRRFRPQRSFLALLDTADGCALWRWHRLWGHARWAGRLKRRIDGDFVRRYQADAASEKMIPA